MCFWSFLWHVFFPKASLWWRTWSKRVKMGFSFQVDFKFRPHQMKPRLMRKSTDEQFLSWHRGFLGIHPCGHVSTKCLDWFKICALALMHNHLIVHTFLPLLSLFLSHLVVRVPLQHGQQLYRHIYLGCKEDDNVHKNFELLFTTLAVLTIELANEEVVIDLIRLAIALQVTLPLTYSSVSCDQVAFYYTFCCMRVTSQAVKVWREKEEAAKFN